MTDAQTHANVLVFFHQVPEELAAAKEPETGGQLSGHDPLLKDDGGDEGFHQQKHDLKSQTSGGIRIR